VVAVLHNFTDDGFDSSAEVDESPESQPERTIVIPDPSLPTLTG
jgi:hypothetical protein